MTYFILGDRGRIGRAISSGAEFESDYLGKIIQLSLSLPKSSRERINKFMIEKLEEYLQKIGLSKEQKEITSLNKLLFFEAFWNLREVKVFLSNLEMVIPMFVLGDELEVNLWDLLVIELIRYQYPELYRQVYYSKMEILSSPGEVLDHFVKKSGSKVSRNTLDFLETALSSKMAREKGLADLRYFDLYFQFSVPEYFTKSKVEEFLRLLSGELDELQIETLYKEILNRDLSFDDIERHVFYDTDLEIRIGDFEIFKVAQSVLLKQANPVFAFNRFSGFFYWIIGTLDRENTERYLKKSLEPSLRVLFIFFLFDNLTSKSAITSNEYYTKKLLINYRDELIESIAHGENLHKEFWYGRLFHLWFDYNKNSLTMSLLRIPQTKEDLVILFRHFSETYVISGRYRVKKEKSLNLSLLVEALGHNNFILLYEIAKPQLLAEGYSEFELEEV